MNTARKQTVARTMAVGLVLMLSAVWLISSRSGTLPVAAITAERVTARPDYSEFQHATIAHKMDCAACHSFPSPNWKTVREEKDAFEDITEYPKHESCLKCHAQQFFRGAPPVICKICHTNPSPRNSARHPYPNPREKFDQSPKGKKAQSDFVVAFPHATHVEIVSSTNAAVRFVTAAFDRRAGEESCAVCHKTMAPQDKSDEEFLTKPPPKWGDAFWLKKGTFKSTPIGHTTCFTCHSADTGILPTGDKCASCHTLKPPQPPSDFDAALAKTMGINDKVMLDRWRNRHSAGAFRHEWFSHAELACATCHNVATMNTAVPLTLRVSISACAACHATATSDEGGALNYEIDSRTKSPKFQCAKCHVAFGKMAIPDSHTKALAAAAGK
jgi:Cytochrome c7 and related cytochrome c/Class III cytochrome C family